MKLLHTSDLHIGKRFNEYPLLEDQAYALDQIADIADLEQPDAILLAGDIYDKTVPSAEAVRTFDRFLTRLADGRRSVFIISGNHDSAERLSFGSKLMEPSGVYVAPVYEGAVEPVRIQDGAERCDIYMIPFVRPSWVRRFFPDVSIETYNDALATVVQSIERKPDAKSVLMMHQFIAGASLCDSEEMNVGGLEAVDVSLLDEFDYVALGHLHSPQTVGRETVRYSGSPLKYSFSEIDHKKSVTIIEWEGDSDLAVRTVAIRPLHDVAEYRGAYRTLVERSFYRDKDVEAFTRITLTDDDVIFDALAKLRTIYPRLLRLDYDNVRTQNRTSFLEAEHIRDRDPLDIFSEFFEMQNGQAMSGESKAIVQTLIERIWEGGS